MAPTLFWSHIVLDVVSFLKLVYTAACINKLLLTGKERVTLIADINFQGFHVFGGAGFERSSASAYNRHFMIIGMYIGLHIFFHLA